MAADTFRSELRDIIEHVYIDEFGARATQQMVHQGVWSALPEHLTDFLIGKGISSEVQSYFRVQGNDGLPKFPEVNAAGEHRQLELLSIDEFAFVHTSYLDRADANSAKAEKIRELCMVTHGVDVVAKVVPA